MKIITHKLQMFIDLQYLWDQYKKITLKKKLFKCGLKLFIERLHLTLDYIILNVAEKYQKHELVQHLCRIPRPKLANQHCIIQFFLGLQFCVDFRTSAVNEHA